ncbi:unnamed protein product [Ceutorhynchus assimilis]|uniref:Uncharacterized protein n=1 Tax=Ceutorhynchus assimilis TaxID=467358 RepID=A0A9P0DP30_9CUCU|nr:unnamed protein product [Ceutorhynchus assimilis]
MSTLPEDMYCSEQICIPPSFPYLLRQYAKAAIRTQPTDILRWSTAYFRCLSLNLPPPVKPRLEYPIPRDFRGVTPGWLKALYYQLQNNQTISFKILWDRWMGACLHHNTLIQLLCLGGFDDPLAIQWLRFIAICAGTLTDDLTQTMILICEILTEEPEGGSAMIPLETFLDLYQFLAKIDASQDQNLRNYYFRDSLLSLWREKIEKKESKEEIEDEVLQEDVRSLATKSSSVIMDTGEKLDEIERVVSCPSLPQDDQYSIDHLIIEEPEDVEEEEKVTEIIDTAPETSTFEESEEVREYQEPREDMPEMNIPEQEGEETDAHLDEDENRKELDNQLEEPEDIYIKAEDLESFTGEPDIADVAVEKEGIVPVSPSLDAKEPTQMATQEDGTGGEMRPLESVDTIIELPVRNLDLVFEDEKTLKEDLERLRAMQQELAGETDEELEKFKCRLIEEMPLAESQEEGIKHFSMGEALLLEPSGEEKLKIATEITAPGSETLVDGEAALEQQYDDVFVEAVPGIGGTVPDKLIGVVVQYMTNCAKNQRGMIMPRNIRHYSCPPLEVVPT